ncbi:hypothetical protein Ami103574_02400 [Aminipila butyrica]|uniref:DnaD domain-containing protein n=1 Tax=Aminipila butyrica TaxID=433296 RepID=A0A858BTG8_9FIRM|nr:hypothetical protein [Aminipila butyrica]QIB68230.1 hypothetical protein Ami103574_02400 [Aminipila butyrica]
MDKGYFKVYRKVFNNPIWSIKPYSKGQALIELIGTANYRPQTIILGNEEVEIKRGQLHTSEVKLAEKWGWSRKKVRTYLEQLERLKMVTTVGTTKGTTITIENYELYQGEGTADDTADGTLQEHQKNIKRTSKDTRTIKIKKEKKDKKDKNIKKDIAPYPLAEFGFSSSVESKIEEWVAYKLEKKDTYTVIGFKKLMTIVQNNISQYGENRVLALIDECMANNWKGVIWEKLRKEGGTEKAKNNARDESEGGEYDYNKFFEN